MAFDFSRQYPKLSQVITIIDKFLATEHPTFFGSSPIHPFSSLKPSKVIHDNLWGTNSFNWRELAIIDAPIFQRLRYIHQTGLAHFVYPCAHHTRFEHSLGVCTMASRVFDALLRQREAVLRTIAKELFAEREFTRVLGAWRAELRLAALLHDTGHSLHSHTSEIVYSEIPLLKEAAKELSKFVGTDKGVGEVLSYCISKTPCLRQFLERANRKVKSPDESDSDVDMENVSLLIVGRSKYPQLQFLGDIISSDLDADKLDYLLRDATAAGLPLRYDLERYLYTVGLSEQVLSDGAGILEQLYGSVGATPTRHEPTDKIKYPHYKAYRFQLGPQAINTIEQIIICKFMLFSYIYHHKKVRAGEGLLARLIHRTAEGWRKTGMGDADLICQFLRTNDQALDGQTFRSTDGDISDYLERITNRVLPREAMGFTSNLEHSESSKVSKFMADLSDSAKTKALIANFENVLGNEILRLRPTIASTKEEALSRVGAWLDVPKPPKFNKLEELLVGTTKIHEIFPIDSWIQAYISYRYRVRVFAFSEYLDLVREATKKPCEQILGIKDPAFVDQLGPERE